MKENRRNELSPNPRPVLYQQFFQKATKSWARRTADQSEMKPNMLYPIKNI